MKCRRCRIELGTSFRAGEGNLEPGLSNHVADCPECAQFAEQVRATSRLVGALGQTTAPAGARDRLRARLAAERQRPVRSSWLEAWRAPILQPRQALVAAGVLAVMLVVLAVAVHGLLPMAGGPAATPTVADLAPAPASGAMPVSFEATPAMQRMMLQHQTHEIAYPWHHDAGFYMVNGE